METAARRHIALVAPELTTFEEARAVIRRLREPVILALGLQESGVAETAKLLRRGVEIIISRGETAKMIKAAFPDLAVVAIKRTGLDIARALGRAVKHDCPIAAVSFPDTLDRIMAVFEALEIPVRGYRIDTRPQAEGAVLKAVAEGAGVVVGVASTVAAARRLGVPCELVQSGVESLTEAIEEAQGIMQARQVDKAKMSLLRTVLDATDDGIVAVDKLGMITVFNTLAERVTGLDAAEVTGRHIDQVWPQIGLSRLLRKGSSEPHLLVKAKDKTLVCTVTPVTVDGAVNGAVCTFYDAGRIQAMEATVRRRLHASGHVAPFHFRDIQGKSPALRRVVTTAKQYARSEDTVLLAGETGTGKELFAQGIHNHSPRLRGPFVAVNCAALPGHLLESELFGYVAGAFTGASSKGKAGLFELAHGGTIFLDEVTEMELGIQAKLLRVLQERKVMRLGADQVIPVNVRIIASTNMDVQALAGSNSFRRDLYYRLNVLFVHLPPLRERQQDIPCLCGHFLRLRMKPDSVPPTFTKEAMAMLMAHPWPGNVRELQNVMARVSAMGRGGKVDAPALRSILGVTVGAPGQRRFAREEAERIMDVLREAHGSRTRAAAALGISRSTLWRKMREYGI